MDRHFLVPATIAAALHAGLLFGIHPDKHLTKALAKPGTVITEWFVPPEPPPPELNTSVSAAAGGTPRPSIGEPPPVDSPSPHKIDYTFTPASLPNIRSDTIPVGPVGLPNAAGDKPGINPNGIFVGTDLDSTPRTRVTANPVYPHEAKTLGLGGEVLVEFVVDESGAVQAPHVVRSSSRLFEESALRAVARWKFEPGKRLGKVVRFRMALPIVFSLNEN